MSFQNVLSVTAGVLCVAGYIPYIIAILRGETRPKKVTWMIWAVVETTLLAGMYAKDTINGQILGSVVGIWIIVAFALKYGIPGWTRLDKICLGSAMLGILLWKLFNNPTLGIIISLAVIFIGSIPTFASAWKNPYQEDKLAWTIFLISSLCATIAIPHWTLADTGQPIIFLLIDTIIIFLLFFPSYEPATS